jgi:hypothetical protein
MHALYDHDDGLFSIVSSRKRTVDDIGDVPEQFIDNDIDWIVQESHIRSIAGSHGLLGGHVLVFGNAFGVRFFAIRVTPPQPFSDSVLTMILDTSKKKVRMRCLSACFSRCPLSFAAAAAAEPKHAIVWIFDGANSQNANTTHGVPLHVTAYMVYQLLKVWEVKKVSVNPRQFSIMPSWAYAC